MTYLEVSTMDTDAVIPSCFHIIALPFLLHQSNITFNITTQ